MGKNAKINKTIKIKTIQMINPGNHYCKFHVFSKTVEDCQNKIGTPCRKLFKKINKIKE